MTDDPYLLDEAVRIASDARVELDVAPDPVAARTRFAAAPLVLVGVRAAEACARARLPRRPGVVLVVVEPLEQPPWDVAENLGAEHIAVLPAAEPWLVDRLAAAVGAPRPAAVVAVLGGRGGAGTSVLAAGLAVTAARAGLRALLVDADPIGGGADLVLGWEDLDGLRWPALSHGSSGVAPPALVDALPNRGELAVLSWDRGELVSVPPDAMEAALDAGRASRDLVVVDLPRRLDDAAVVALTAADRALLLVPAELRACAAAARVAAVAAVHTGALRVVVRGPAPGRLKAREIARALGLPLAGTLRSEPELARAIERGQPPAGTGRGRLALLCQRILRELNLEAREPVA
ncbi:septum site-determining protein minD [Planosporangium thailandense]|uniref:Septum site-determining protein minD n=1 Tax=Planosporangium thailandense TaxID=765197 RepID=A0ABX0Y6E8_9ACTN|nr:septum site-determining protein minD [Planosporangium thailandense]